MRILLKIILMLIGLGLMGGGGMLAVAGFAYTDGESPLKSVREIPLKEEMREIVRDARGELRALPKEVQDYLKISEHNMLVPLGGGGSLLAFIGLILFLNGAFRYKAAVRQEIEAKKNLAADVVSDEIVSNVRHEEPAADGGGGGEKFAIDESFLEEEEDELTKKLRSIGFLVQLAQGDIDSESATGAIKVYRPDLVEYLDLFEGKSKTYLALQIINSVILRHRRVKDDITADQFQTQDTRINECERATFARRYMPAKNKITNDKIRATVGKVYDVNEQALVQQKFSGEAEDWRDLSLRTAKEELSAKTALEESAAPAPVPPPAPPPQQPPAS